MAKTEGKTSALVLNSLQAVDTLQALDTEGIAIPYNVADDGKIVLIVENGGGADGEITVAKGNGLQGVADYKVTIPAGATWYGVFESGAYANVSGPDKGMLVLTGPTDMLAGALSLPY